MTEMEERLMTRFMQADGERNEANRERDEARAEHAVTVEHLNQVMVDHKALRKAGSALAEAAFRVVHDFDGVHRLFLAVSALAKVLADEGGRDEAPAGQPTPEVDDGNAPQSWRGTRTWRSEGCTT